MRQITNNVIMIRPAAFGFNPETASNNSFQVNDQSESNEVITSKAVVEFDEFVEKLRDHRVDVMVLDDSPTPRKADAVFPNNWISFHEDGQVINYSMYSPMRRQERRPELLQIIGEKFEIDRDYTFEHYEEKNLFLEGTGSLILDRKNKIAYAALSQRTDPTLLDKWCILMGYEKVQFISVDRAGDPIYHTNVMMALGLNFVIVCMDSIPNESEKNKLRTVLKRTGKELIIISYDQMESFAGNMLQVGHEEGQHYLVMSSTAYESLDAEQIEKIEAYTSILTGNIPTIEKYGGGSVRCMIAENFLPSKS